MSICKTGNEKFVPTRPHERMVKVYFRVYYMSFKDFQDSTAISKAQVRLYLGPSEIVYIDQSRAARINVNCQAGPLDILVSYISQNKTTAWVWCTTNMYQLFAKLLRQQDNGFCARTRCNVSERFSLGCAARLSALVMTSSD